MPTAIWPPEVLPHRLQFYGEPEPLIAAGRHRFGHNPQNPGTSVRALQHWPVDCYTTDLSLPDAEIFRHSINVSTSVIDTVDPTKLVGTWVGQFEHFRVPMLAGPSCLRGVAPDERWTALVPAYYLQTWSIFDDTRYRFIDRVFVQSPSQDYNLIRFQRFEPMDFYPAGTEEEMPPQPDFLPLPDPV